MKLNQKLVDRIETSEDRVVWDDDAPGLGLRVQAGKRTWIVRYRVGGSSRQKSLDGNLPLKRARIRAAEIRTGASGGTDIVAAGRAAAAEARRKADDAKSRSLGAIVDLYLAASVERLRPASLRVARSYLRGQWAALHERPADDLTRREIVTVLEPYAGRTTAIQLLRHLSACLSWAMERGLLEKNTAIGVKPPAERAARERVLSNEEIRTLWRATDGAATGAEREFHAIVRLSLLLGQRRAEIGGMQWSEIDLDRELWSLPGNRTKNGQPHSLPLPRQAWEILRAQPRAGQHVFGRRGFTSWDRRKARLDAALNLPPWVLHDLRRTVVTGMAEIGIQPHIVEAVVNHISGHKAGVAGTYNKALYSQEKRAAMQRWADHVERVVAGEPAGNVVGFGR